MVSPCEKLGWFDPTHDPWSVYTWADLVKGQGWHTLRFFSKKKLLDINM